jgi:hypothetical protein
MRMLLSSLPLIFATAVWADDETSQGKPSVVLGKLIAQLGSDDFEIRRKATEELSQLDEVPTELRAATRSDDLEVRHRAQSAVEAITTRADEKRFRALAAELQKVELDRFVQRMVREPDFASDKQWDFVRVLARSVTARANELADRKFDVPDLDAKSLPLLSGSVPRKGTVSGKRILFDDRSEFQSAFADGCVVLGTGQLTSFKGLHRSIVILDGNLSHGMAIVGCLVIVRGTFSCQQLVRDSIILADGFDWVGVSENTFFQIKKKKLRFGEASNNLYINSTTESNEPDLTSRMLESDRGPLHLLRFSEKKKESNPKH